MIEFQLDSTSGVATYLQLVQQVQTELPALVVALPGPQVLTASMVLPV